MRTDTESLRTFAAVLRGLQNPGSVSPDILWRHQQIQNSLFRLQLWFEQTASAAEQAESQLLQDPASIWKPGTLTCTHTELWNLGQQLQKRPVSTTLKGTVSKAALTAVVSDYGQHHSFYTSLNVLPAFGSGEASVRLWKDKMLSPAVTLKGEASASLLSVSGIYQVSAGPASAVLNVKGEAGAVYARAEAVLSVEEQSLEVGIGGAAVRGECSLAFSLAGCTITLTGQGSVGNAEASLSYHHRNREWEFGSKLGFIAGLGFKVKVNY